MTKCIEPKYPVNPEYESLLREIAKNIKLLPKLRAMAEGRE